MKCAVCGSELREANTDLPFKLGDKSIVILKDLPVLQCEPCSEYLLQDGTMKKVDEILGRVGSGAELEIIRYAA